MQCKRLLAMRTGVLLLCLAATGSLAQTHTVTSCTEAALRSAMAGGGTVTFACSGTITLGNTVVIATDTVLDASGRQVTINGGNLVRVFYVNTNITLTLINLTLANGLSADGCGGGIYNEGVLTATNCHFVSNRVQGALAFPGQDGCGGAVYNSGALNIIDCSFAWNSAGGGGGSQPGASGGTARGGAICNLGSMVIERSLFASNTNAGGAGATGYSPGYGSPAPGFPGLPGGNAFGGALFVSGPSTLVNCTLTGNQATGGSGGAGGNGGWWVNLGTGQWFVGPGGSGAGGGAACGAVYDAAGALRITNCTIAFNSSVGGVGGVGGSGSQPGSTAGNGASAGGLQTANGVLANCLLDGNHPTNSTSSLNDAGHNLSSDASCTFTNVGSLNNTDARLGPLADNGGPTLTMALLPGSPAIDAGDTALAPATDQRGFPRPVGPAADIGAYEFSPPVMASLLPSQTTETGTTVDLRAPVSGPALYYHWFFNGNVLVNCTNCVLCLSGVQASNVGSYSLVVTNADGAITSAPVMLNVIAPVGRRPVPAIRLTGESASLLKVDYANSLGPVPIWTTLDSVTLTNTSQFYFDLSPLPPQRFYRAWQTGTPGVVPSLDMKMVPAITLTGNVGDSLRLDYINQFGPIDAWVALGTVTLTNTSQLYFDTSSMGQPARLWRIVPAP